MRATGYKLLFYFTFLSGMYTSAEGQINSSAFNKELWPEIESRLNNPDNDLAYDFIPALVKDFCDNNPDSIHATYYALMIKLEREYNMPAAIYAGNQVVATSRLQHDLDKLAGAYSNLSRYYYASGDYRLAAISIDSALSVYSQLNNREALLATRLIKIQHSSHFKKAVVIIPGLNALLEEAKTTGNKKLVNNIRLSHIHYSLQAGQLDDAEKNIAVLEKIPVSTPVKQDEYPALILTARARAELAQARNNPDEAARYYLQAVHYCEAEPSRWMEANILLALSELEWKRGNTQSAKNYLDQAQTKAENLQLFDLLSNAYALKAIIAGKEKFFEEAIDYLKMEQEYEEKFRASSYGFNAESYYLQVDKDQLVEEGKNQDLKLQLKKSQLSNSIYILLFLAILVAGLGIGFYYQRKGKAALARQNLLIQQQDEKLKTLDAAKSRFFANVSHEIRTPLSLILGPVNLLLKENQLNEKQVKLLNTVNQHSKELEVMINNILDLRKLEMGKMELHTAPTLLYPFFQSNINQFESLAEHKQIRFSYRINIHAGVSAHIDKEKCRQVITNFLSNAFKFTKESGQIQVEVSLTDNILKCKVANTGPGIHPDDLPYVFDRFYQSRRKDNPETGGTGIGLSLCHDIAALFNGNICAESEWGKGAAFYFSFPVTVTRQENDANLQANGSGANNIAERAAPPARSFIYNDPPIKFDNSKPVILVVEDNRDLQEFIGLLLAGQYNVITAENGKAALEKLAGKPGQPMADLILSDLMMPVMDGFQLLEKLKSGDATRHIPVIMLTARADAGDRLKALRIGVDDYMIKPFEEEELLVRIENLLHNLHIRKEEAMILAEETEAPPQLIVTGPDKEWLEKFEQYIQKKIGDEFLTVSSLADEFAMSGSTLLRQLKRLTGLTPSQYLQEIRLNEARQLIENRTYTSIAKVAEKVGYNDVRSFSRRFKNRFGKSPSDSK